MKKTSKKATRIIRNEDYAFLEGTTIYINIEKLWKEAKRIDKFIRDFAKSHTHEMLHLVLSNEGLQGSALGEEKTIRKILGEEWDSRLERIYEGEEA